MNSIAAKGKKLVNKNILTTVALIIAVSGCASKPQWIYPSGESRQFYEDDNLCSMRAERSMGNAGNYEPNDQNTYSNAGASIGNAIATVVAKRRAMGEYKKCMRSMGYIESN